MFCSSLLSDDLSAPRRSASFSGGFTVLQLVCQANGRLMISRGIDSVRFLLWETDFTQKLVPSKINKYIIMTYSSNP